MSIRKQSVPFAPARGLDAVLRVGAAAAKAKRENMEAFLQEASEKLSAESNQLTELTSTIIKLRLALKRSKHETESETAALQLALSQCESRRTQLEMKLAARAVGVRKFNRIKYDGPPYVPYEEPAYVPYAG